MPPLRLTVSAVTTLVLIFVTNSGWGAGTGSKDPAAKARAERERQAQAARDTVESLAPGPRQARRLLALVAKAASLQVEHYRSEAALQPAMLEAFGDFAREDRVGQGFSRDVEKRTAEASRKAKGLDEQFTADMKELEAETRALLSTSQRQIVEPPAQTAAGPESQSSDDPAVRLTAARRELAELQRELHPQAGPIAQQLLHPAAGEGLARLGGGRVPDEIRLALAVPESGTNEFPRAQFEERQAAIQKLRTEINNWNLINGLNLTRDQIDRIVIIYEQRPPEKISKRYAATCMFELERAVADVLNAGQRQVLGEYKACLIPPKNLKDPVRVGQASDRSQMEQWLTRARKLPPAKLPEVVDKKMAEEAEHFGKLSGAQQQRRVALLTETVNKAAALSDVDFEISKADLASKIAPCDRPAELKSEIARLGAEQGQTGPVARFILNPAFIEQVRLRGQQMAAAPEPDDAGAAVDAGTTIGQQAPP